MALAVAPLGVSLNNQFFRLCSVAHKRKNFLFHDTVKGAKASAIVYTLTETAKANGLNIRLYLETVMTKMLGYKNEPDSILEELMPWSEAMYTVNS
ncbi:MAG: transposase domain-containing protein [Hungatella sp.]|nr:transposase domain-containing protein [Hungatella sp.]